MERLLPHVQHYAWGSETAIPELLGVEPDGRPWAEMWIGDHPRLPSTVAATGQPLDAGLPFLLKLLAADVPLSIQTHPSKARAEAGFAAEEAAGVPIDAPHRTYRDDNHKPELICALTPFDALVGFRPADELIDLYGAVPPLEPLVDRLQGPQPIRTALEWLLRLPADEVAALIGEVVADGSPDVELVSELVAHFPDDRGALVGLLLHRVQLEPGQAIFLGAGNLHAYLSGFGVEVMANSDNVIRGGLTPKHIDIDELLDVVSFDAFAPDIQTAVEPIHTFDSTGAGFELSRLAGPDGLRVAPTGAELVLVTDGVVQLRCADGSHVALAAGESAFVDGSADYTLRGDGVAWRVATGR